MGKSVNRRPATEAVLGELCSPSMGGRFFDASQAYKEAIVTALRAMGHNVTGSQVGILTHITNEKSNITLIAERASTTRQGVIAILQILQRNGYVEYMINPDDRRSRMVSFTPQGSQLLEDIKEAMGFLEKEIENRIGVREFDKMAKVLDDYISSIKSDPLSIKVYRTHVSKKRNGKSPV